MFGPKRTVKSLILELETGLQKGTIVLDSTAAAQRKDWISDNAKEAPAMGRTRGEFMKRDMDLVRKILLCVEEQGESPLGWVNLDIPEYSPEQVAYRVLLLRDAGLVEAQDLSSTRGFDMRPKRLTWSGHEFLEAAKNDTVWNKAKEIVKEKGGSIPFEVLKALLMKLTLSLFGLS